LPFKPSLEHCHKRRKPYACAGKISGNLMKNSILGFGFLVAIGIGAVVIGSGRSGSTSTATAGQFDTTATSPATFDEVEQAVGCSNTLSDAKREDIFNRDYYGRTVTWSGTIVDSISGVIVVQPQNGTVGRVSVSLNEHGQRRVGLPITVRFRLIGRNNGTCTGYDFSGNDGVIISTNAFSVPVSSMSSAQAIAKYNGLNGYDGDKFTIA
jgi:hypothetical protein